MNLRYLLLAITCASLSTLAHALDRPDAPPPGDGQRHEIPAEAFAACKGKQEGERASMTTPRGEMRGTCEKAGERLALRPERRAENDSGKPAHEGHQPPRD